MLTSTKSKVLAIIAVIILIVVGSYIGLALRKSSTVGAVGGQLIEDVDPYFRNNGGMNTGLPIKTTSTSQVGTSGTALANFIVTTCTPTNVNLTQVATSTAPYDCPVTGVTSSDMVIAQFSTTTQSTNNDSTPFGLFDIISAHASSTSGFVTLMIHNGSGRSLTLATASGIASSTNLFIAH